MILSTGYVLKTFRFIDYLYVIIWRQLCSFHFKKIPRHLLHAHVMSRCQERKEKTTFWSIFLWIFILNNFTLRVRPKFLPRLIYRQEKFFLCNGNACKSWPLQDITIWTCCWTFENKVSKRLLQALIQKWNIFKWEYPTYN